MIKTTRGEHGTTVLQTVSVVLDKDTLTLDAVDEAIRQDARNDARDPAFREFVRQAAVVQLYAMIFNAAVTPPSVTRNAQSNAERQQRWRDNQKTKAAAQPVTVSAAPEPPEPLRVTPVEAPAVVAVVPEPAPTLPVAVADASGTITAEPTPTESGLVSVSAPAAAFAALAAQLEAEEPGRRPHPAIVPPVQTMDPADVSTDVSTPVSPTPADDAEPVLEEGAIPVAAAQRRHIDIPDTSPVTRW